MFDVFDLVATLRLDSSDYEKGLSSAEGSLSSMGDKIGSGLATAAKVGVAAVGAAATAVGALTKQAVEGFGEYQQLVGGVETLFKDSADVVIENAKRAYQTAGVSTNDYMETVTSFSASLLQSLGGDTAKAADYANRATIDMADNANKMGTAMESIQNAYQGFAKQNYTMLDNLKLGYGGTKEEMARLISDASKMTGIQKELNLAVNAGDLSFGNIVNAISVMQKSLGIAGTTALEAGETIQGSIGALKAAWQNLVTGFADPDADLGTLIDNVIQSGKTALTNLIPTIRQALTGIAQAIKEIVPVITAELPGLVNDVLPPLIDAAATLVAAIVANLPQIISVLVEAMPGVISTIKDALVDAWPEITDAIMAALDTTGGKVILAVAGIVTAVKAQGIVSGLMNIISVIERLGGSVIPSLSTSMTTAATNSAALAAEGSALAGVLGTVATAALGVGDALLVAYDVRALKEAHDTYEEANDTFWGEINNSMENFRVLYETQGDEVAAEWARMVYGIDTMGMTLEEGQAALRTRIESLWDGVPRNMWDGFVAGWDDYFGVDGRGLFALLGDAFSGAVNGVKRLLGISSPSKVFRGIGTNITEGLSEGILGGLSSVDDAMDDLGDSLMMSDDSYADDFITTTATSVSEDPYAGRDMVESDNGYTQPVVIVLEMDGVELGRASMPYLSRESKRLGVDLAGGLA